MGQNCLENVRKTNKTTLKGNKNVELVKYSETVFKMPKEATKKKKKEKEKSNEFPNPKAFII